MLQDSKDNITSISYEKGQTKPLLILSSLHAGNELRKDEVTHFRSEEEKQDFQVFNIQLSKLTQPFKIPHKACLFPGRFPTLICA